METYVETIITIHQARTNEAMSKSVHRSSRSPKLRRSWNWNMQPVARRRSRPAH